jgi:hypothetical protein
LHRIEQSGMRKLILIGILVFSLSSVMAQSGEEDMIRLKQGVESVVTEERLDEQGAEESQVRTVEGYQAKPGHWDFSVGTSYSYMKGYGSGMMFYTAPSYTLSLSDRWSLHGGVVASHYQGLNYTGQGESLLPGTFSSLAIFGAASYRVSDRLIFHGAGVKQLITAPNTLVIGYPADNLSLGASYRIGDNITIGASVHMQNRNGYYSSPYFGNPFFPSPIGW